MSVTQSYWPLGGKKCFLSGPEFWAYCNVFRVKKNYLPKIVNGHWLYCLFFIFKFAKPCLAHMHNLFIFDTFSLTFTQSVTAFKYKIDEIR